MSVSRRDFIKLFGISLASLLMTRCKPKEPPTPPTPLCYAPTAAPPSTPTDMPLSARNRLRLCWLSFGELAQKTNAASGSGDTSDAYGQQLTADHRLALDELVAAGEVSTPVADLVQEAYEAAVYHVWRSNVLITCYITMGPPYAPESAAVLVQQAEVLGSLADQGTIDPQTLAKAQVALEHDMAFYALSEADVQALYDSLRANGESYPSFEEVGLEPTTNAKAAARFILDLLTGI